MVVSPSCSESLADRGIDEEHHRHFPRLARLEPLLGEAETVDLGEIGADRRRRYVVGRLAHGLARRLVGHHVIHGDDVADAQSRRILLRLEPPRQAAGRHWRRSARRSCGERMGRRSSRPGSCRQIRWCGRTSCRTAPPRRPRPPSPPRTRRRRAATTMSRRRCGLWSVRRSSHLLSGGHRGRSSTPGPFISVTV